MDPTNQKYFHSAWSHIKQRMVSQPCCLWHHCILSRFLLLVSLFVCPSHLKLFHILNEDLFPPPLSCTRRQLWSSVPMLTLMNDLRLRGPVLSSLTVHLKACYLLYTPPPPCGRHLPHITAPSYRCLQSTTLLLSHFLLPCCLSQFCFSLLWCNFWNGVN